MTESKKTCTSSSAAHAYLIWILDSINSTFELEIHSINMKVPPFIRDRAIAETTETLLQTPLTDLEFCELKGYLLWHEFYLIDRQIIDYDWWVYHESLRLRHANTHQTRENKQKQWNIIWQVCAGLIWTLLILQGCPWSKNNGRLYGNWPRAWYGHF